MLARTVERQVGPDEFAADDVRLEFGIVEPGRPLHVAESGGHAIDHANAGQVDSKSTVDRNDVRDHLAARHVEHRGGLRDGDGAAQILVKWDVVVEQLTRTGRLTAVQRQVHVVDRSGAARRNRRRWRQLRSLDLAVLGRGHNRIVRRAGTQRHVERQRRQVRSRRNNFRHGIDEVAARRGHANRVIRPARARRIREIQVELVISVGQRDLVLLHRIIEAVAGQRHAAAGVHQGDGCAGQRPTRDGIVDDAIRIDR